ncbi:enoyl-CoA hydratase/isomerase family protein [Verminephrobacter eiseniae]|uniref:Short chain enoyl-CoA hydratase n=1 Tax=Verminephrobacter eiseniae (strain EF01-2) TaxID=391735 RepID=A1WPM2_VEREI|nr:enoyl-CoA hydratase-related protein [Verminephrobacter eiseniae]ABM59579.1 short chain enoyl-CoA hydratase [Verminephrobacter eiseniae EF01-2]MCW5230994.1 crotonase [Verminephrobacter eiseniae]MCW5285098.1 crotonase [Verminephrobacter eiseniae]MCW5292727.1 crotonase [Verminephrobacter eiseniae]MCW5302806.1 crotonase [Verminephrobacter eiseniae]
MDYSTLLYEVAEGVALIRLNRPERMNAIGGAMKTELRQALLERARQDPQVRCVILTGAGERAFCAGADIKERAGQALPQPEYHLQQKATLALFREMEQFEKPLIAAINGVAMGGGLEIALCCDVRIAARGARLGLPEAKIGALPAAGGTQRLPRLVGPGIAKELMLTGDAIGAERALAIGLINQVVEPEALLPTALAMASRMAANAPLALRHIKHAVDQGMQVGIDAGLEYERYAAALVVSSEDRLEGMRAFVEKRQPRFIGR